MRKALAVLILLSAGCAVNPGDAGAGPLVEIGGVEGGGAERALLYYAGGLASPESADPLETGLLVRSSASEYALNPELLPADLRARLLGDGGTGSVDWETQLKPAFQETYAQARSLPATIQALQGRVGGWGAADSAWFVHEVDGVMTAARRRLFVRSEAARAAALAMAEEKPAAYPAGTVIVGEHWLDGRLAETTVKLRRADGHWDFAVYDAEGQLADGTSTPPRALAAPAKCVGCHLGSKLHQPEKAFPADAPAGPDGPRAVYVPEPWRAAAAEADLALRFQEHARRADGVLGLYGTLYAARTLARARAGDVLAEADSTLLRALEAGS